jgi:hypothetical protein
LVSPSMVMANRLSLTLQLALAGPSARGALSPRRHRGNKGTKHNPDGLGRLEDPRNVFIQYNNQRALPGLEGKTVWLCLGIVEMILRAKLFRDLNLPLMYSGFLHILFSLPA